MAALHRRAAERTRRFAPRRRSVQYARLRLRLFLVKIGLMNEIHVRLQFVVPIKDIQVTRTEVERPRHVEVPREECENDGDGNTEPEDRGFKQKVIVAVDSCGNPSRGDNGINGLEQRVRTERLHRKSTRKKRTVYPKISTMPINTAKNTQAVQNLVFSPLKRFAVIAAEMTIVVENS